MSLTVVTSKAQFDTALSSAGEKPVFVDFMADWCGNCELICPTLEEKAAELGDGAVFLKVDVDENEDIAEKYEVTSLPRVIVFKKGDKVGEMFGNKPEKYIEIINAHKWVKCR